MSETLASPKLRFDRDGLQIEFPALFGVGAEGQCRRFVRRVFVFPGIRSLRLEPALGKATVHCQTGGGRAELLQRLAAAIGGTEEGLDDGLLPDWKPGEPVTLHRFGAGVSVFEASQTSPGRLQLRHAALTRDPALGRRLGDAVRALVGVRQATVTATTGKLSVSYQPGSVDSFHIIRTAEAQLAVPQTALATIDAEPVSLGFANTALGLAALGEFALPLALPLSVGMLVVSNLGTLREAGQQMGHGKAGLPVLYTALLGCSIITGQIVAHALMEWSFRFWAQRSNTVLAEECRALLEANLPIPTHSRLVRSDEVDAKVPTATMRAGHRIRLEGLGPVPVDGCVVSGSALVDESVVCGSANPVRKSQGDAVFAGSRVLAGHVEVEVRQTGAHTRAACIASSVIATSRGLAHHPALRRKAQALADPTVAPTLAVAALGWAVGGLFTSGAVMHADYATGPNLAVPLEHLRGMGRALRSGAVVRNGDALQRLAESRFIVLGDHPAWTALGIELERLEHRLAESETDKLLCHVAGAGLYLGDGRSTALAETCRERGLVVRQPQLLALDADRIVVRQGRHTILLRSDADESTVTPLKVEIDGEEVATLRFRHASTPSAATAVQRLRQLGMDVFLLSSRPEQETGQLAQRLGVELSSGDFTEAEQLRFMQGLRSRGVKATYIGNGQLRPDLAAEAHVSVSLGGGEGALAEGVADIVMLGDALDAFANVTEWAMGHDGRIRAACQKSLLPNLLCVAGGYAGVLNGITAGLLANVGVGNVYRQATQSLRDNQRPPSANRTPV
ncbi:MAG: cation-transporting ATPase [Candidatus Methylumidiphilus sp.]